MTEYELPHYAKFVITVFCVGSAFVTMGAIYQYGMLAMYVPGIAMIVVSVMIWSMVMDVKKI